MGVNYINFRKHFFNNLVYPNAWLSIIYFFARQFKKFLKKGPIVMIQDVIITN